VRNFNYLDFLATNYPVYCYKEQDLEEMFNYFSNFEIIGYDIVKGVIYYLAKNPDKAE